MKRISAYFSLKGRIWFWAACVVLSSAGMLPGAGSAVAAQTALAAIRTPEGMDQELARPPDAPREAGEHGFRVELAKSAPMAGGVRVGGAVSFAARLYNGKREMPHEGYVCRWQSDAGARFLKDEGPFTNTVVFLRPGRQRVWVEVVPQSGPSQGLAAASVPLELDVAPPVFSLTVSPAAPLVGEDVTVSIRDFPVHDGVEFRWDQLPEAAKLVQVGEQDLTFYATTAGTVPVRVTAVVGAGESGSVDLGSATAQVPSHDYAVTIENKGLAEVPATIWRDGEGPVAAEGVAVRQKVRLRATVTPAPHNPPLSYAWSLCPGARARGDTDGREVEASRDAVGPCRATVEVRDARGLLLGRGAGGFTVAVSQADLEAAVAKAREVDRLTQAAGDAWAAGKPGLALETAEQAVRQSPANPAALTALDRIGRDKTRLDGTLAKAADALAVDDFSEVTAMLGEAAKINARAPAIEVLRNQAVTRRDILDRVDKLLAEAREKWDAGDVDAALARTGQALDLDPRHGAARNARQRLLAERDRLIAALKQASSYLQAKRFDSASKSLGEARAINPRFKVVGELDQAIAARKDKAWRLDQDLARARDQWDAGDADGALATLTEAVALDPEHPGAAAARKKLAQARENLARAEDRAETAIHGGKAEEARVALAEAARINPHHGRLAALQGLWAQRIDRDKRIASLRADVAKRSAAGDVDGAIAALDALLGQLPGDADTQAARDKLVRARDAAAEALGRARDFLAGRRYDLALAAVAEAEKSRPKLPEAAAWRKKIQAAQKQAETQAAARLAQAEKCLTGRDPAGAQQALQLSRDQGPLSPALSAKARDVEQRLAAFLANEDVARKKEQALRAATPGKTADATRQTRCADIARNAAAKRKAGDHAGAIHDYQTLLNMCPDTCPAYNNVGASLFTLGYTAEALPWFDEAVKCAPQEKLYRNNVALTRQRLAGQQPRSTVEAADSCATTFAAAEARRDGGDLAGAMTGYQAVVAQCPNFCAAYNNLGLTLHKLGRTADALPLFERARQCNPKDTLFRENYELTAQRLRTADRAR